MLPLAGTRVIVTRAVHQAEELARPLREQGADVICIPMIAIAPPADPAPLREAAAECDTYQWIIFTSANAVQAFAAELPEPKGAVRARIAAIGRATRTAAERLGFNVSLVPEKYVAESLAAAFAGEDIRGTRVLIPRAAVARDIVPDALKELGAEVVTVEAYRNELPPEAAQLAREAFRDPLPDWITFASSSSVDHAVALIGAETLARIRIASIGPITSEKVRNHGLAVDAEAAVSSADDLVKCLIAAQNAKR
jgi:uroporphyrinogen III methyltransferase/synthase